MCIRDRRERAYVRTGLELMTTEVISITVVSLCALKWKSFGLRIKPGSIYGRPCNIRLCNMLNVLFIAYYALNIILDVTSNSFRKRLPIMYGCFVGSQ